jgi:hypothetical protein
MVLRCCSSQTQLYSGAVEVLPCAAANVCVDKCYYNVLFRSMCRAAAFLAQNLLIVACLPCSSSFEPNGLRTIFLRPRGHTPSWQYSFGLAAAPPCGNIPLALWPHPLTAIFIWLNGRAPSRQYFLWPCGCASSWGCLLRPYSRASSQGYFICASWQQSIFSLPHNNNQFHSAYMAIRASQQY